jgi:nitrite reductase/ring-hydroxylating ferredoxin subunit
MVALLVTSNTLSLKWLKGKRWKALQRFNYPLAVLTIIHTVAFQVINLRENWFFIATIGLSVIVLAVQLGGVALTLNRNRKRTEQHGAPALVPATAGGDRRKFIITGASLVVGGFVGGTMIGNQLFKGGSSGSAIAANTTQATQATTTTPAQQGRVEFPQAPGNREGRQRPGFNQTTPGTQTTPGSQVNPGNSGRPVEPGSRNFPGNSTTSPAQSGTTATPAPATTQAASNSGATGNSRVVLATTANLKPGDALKFTTPDTKETAFLVREKDGSVKAFNAICTHRPYMLVWNSNRQALVCDLHAVDFDGVTGAPRNRPARTALKAYSVAIDGQGNIVYNIA